MAPAWPRPADPAAGSPAPLDSSPVRKTVALVLILLLPLQWGWAMAASYCGHEATATHAHFGHHDHAHGDAAPPSLADDPTGDDTADTGAHADCGTCQLSSASAVMPGLRLAMPATAERCPAAAGTWRPDALADLLYRPPLPAAA